MAGGLVVLLGNCAATGLWETSQSFEAFFTTGRWGIFSLTGFLMFLGFAGSVIWFRRKVKALVRPYTRRLSKKDPPERRRHLVLFLSTLKDYEAQDGCPPALSLSGTMEEDLKIIELYKTRERKPGESANWWTYEMPFRAIYHHVRKSSLPDAESGLQTVTLICSPQSILQLPLFIERFQPYAREKGFTFHLFIKENGTGRLTDPPFSPREENGWRFEDFDELSEALYFLLLDFKARRLPESQVMIDFTGGQSVTSAVAVAMTFNREVKAQYVQTNSPWHPKSYDIEYAFTDTGGLGRIWS